MFRKVCAMALVAVMAMPSVANAKVFGFLLNEKEVKEVVRQYLEENPEVIVEAQQKVAMREEELRRAEASKVIVANRVALERDPTSPVLGNPNGDVTIVEFYDYNCGYCKMMFPKVLGEIEVDNGIRWVLKDLPTLGPVSRTAALAGLAAKKQDKFFEMHSALMLYEGNLTDEDIMKEAKKLKLDMNQFKRDMASPELEQILQANRVLAEKLMIRGVPQFIIGDYISNGAMMGNELRENVDLVRSKK